MKKLLPVLFILIITSCSKEVPSDQLVVRDGIYYEVNSQTPFSGTSVKYYENGQLGMRENYKDGKEEGIFEYYYENGQLNRKSTYKNGKEDGLEESYSQNGELQYSTCFQKSEIVDDSHCD